LIISYNCYTIQNHRFKNVKVKIRRSEAPGPRRGPGLALAPVAAGHEKVNVKGSRFWRLRFRTT
jgi:hypothetical protein